MEEGRGFGFFGGKGMCCNDTILWFIILFLLLFCCCGFGKNIDVGC